MAGRLWLAVLLGLLCSAVLLDVAEASKRAREEAFAAGKAIKPKKSSAGQMKDGKDKSAR